MLQRYNIPHAPIPEMSRIVMNLRVIATYIRLSHPLSHPRTSFSPQSSFCPQIITDFHRLFFGTEIHGFFKDTAWLRIDIYTALRDYGLLSQVHGFVSSSVNEPCLYFSIA